MLIDTPSGEQVRLSDGFSLEAAITYPPDFHPMNTYPIWILTYAGPHAPQVRNGWGGSRMMWHHLLAQKGTIGQICKGVMPCEVKRSR